MQHLSQNRAPNPVSNLVQQFNLRIKKQQSKQNSFLKRFKFTAPDIVSTWRKLSKSVLLNRIKQQTDVGSLFKLLFTISKDLQWRQWSHHIQVIIQEIHNKLIKSGDFRVYRLIDKLQMNIERLCCMKDKHISAHLTLLVELLIIVNKFEGILDEQSLSLAILDLAGEAQINSKLLWMLCNVQRIHPQCIGKIVKRELFKSNQLAFLTIASNFMTYCDQRHAVFFLQNQSISNLLTQIFTSQDIKFQIKRQAHLLLNNILGRKGQAFFKVIANQNLMEILLQQKSQETWWTILILTEASKQTKNTYITEENCMNLVKGLKQTGWNNEMIQQRLFLKQQGICY